MANGTVESELVKLRLSGDRPIQRAKEPAVDVRGLWGRLRKDIEGEVRFDAGSRGLYAQDASNYFHVPLGVVIPKSSSDVLATLCACHDFGAPVVSRGGGTGLAGQTCNEAVVLDFSKYLNRVLELDVERRLARVEPGLICDSLTSQTEPHGLTWGPQPATHSHCCFGGMLGNNCGGMRAQQAGIAVHHVEAMTVALHDGTTMNLGWVTEQEFAERARRDSPEGRIYAQLRALRDKYAPLIRERFPNIPRRVSGYNLDQLLPGPDGRINLARAIVGSEGTCVTMLEATLNLVDYFPERAVVALGYDTIEQAADHIVEALSYKPLAVEGMDHVLYEHVVTKHMRQEKFLNVLPKGKGWLLVELGSHDVNDAKARAEQLIDTVKKDRRTLVEAKLIMDRQQQEHLWKVREAGLGATAFVPGQPDAWPGLEDSAVPPERMAEYLRDIRKLMNEFGYQAALYGHFGMGCLHCRISFDLFSHGGIEHYHQFMVRAAKLICDKYGGSISGEHGDGQARGELLSIMFGQELVQAFRQFKAIWDPGGKMNPGKIVDARPLVADLRLGPDYDPAQPSTHFRFPQDQGSFANATLRCVGVGKCRRLNGEGDQDTMCPSFMVTREEKHSTRGRAHLLWEMLRNDTPIDRQFRDENVKEALDLCLSCKGCKGDCPVNVDVATYKAEFLSHYYQGKLRPRHAYAFGWINRWAELATRMPGLVNLLAQSKGTSALFKFAAGMTQERAIPMFAPQSFRSWFEHRAPAAGKGRQRVVLGPDTFNNYLYSETARAAVEVLEALDFEVVVPRQKVCCGRPLYDYGMLDLAKVYLERVLRVMEPELEAGTPIVVLEPSCASVFRDELPNLMPARRAGQRLTQQTLLLSEFLLRYAKGRLPRLERHGIVQGHCHHKSVLDFDAEKKVFAEMGLRVSQPPSGCCGMAGSFGFEADKYDVSVACGERVILPEVRRAGDDTLILANGFSCRTQIEQGTGRRALHLAEALKLAFDQSKGDPTNAGGAAHARPEAPLVEQRSRELRRSMNRARVGVAVAVAAIVGLGWALRSRRRSRWSFA